MSNDEKREVRDVADEQVRRYFQAYLREVVPVQSKRARAETLAMIKDHDLSRKAHGGVEVKLNRLLWMVAGAATVGGGGVGALLTRVLGGV